MFNDGYKVYGNIAIAECVSVNQVSIVADIAIIALGWESRCTALERHIVLSAKKIIVLDFSLTEAGDVTIEASMRRLRDFAANCGTELTELTLRPSVEYQRNIYTLQVALTDLARKVGSYYGTFRRAFVDCSTMPRVYIQWLIAYGFGSGSIQSFDFGYAEGIYGNGGDATIFTSIVRSYETVPLLEGSGGMGEEKLLLVGLGGDADMFYGLVNEFSPERIAVLVPRSPTHTEVDQFLNQQVAKVREMYRLESTEISDVPAFGLAAHLDVFKSYVATTSMHAVISVFVGGPKVQAIASAVFACSDRRVQVKARIPQNYPRREVAPNGSYHLYRLVDVTSPACSLPDTW